MVKTVDINCMYAIKQAFHALGNAKLVIDKFDPSSKHIKLLSIGTKDVVQISISPDGDKWEITISGDEKKYKETSKGYYPLELLSRTEVRFLNL